MKILISESQYYRLFETTDLESGETTDLVSDKPTELVSTETNNKIQQLCTDYPDPNLPYCELLKKSKEIKDSEELNGYVEKLFNVFSHKTRGPLPRIINSSLNTTNTTQYLKTISNFISNENFNQDERKKQLLKLDNLTKSETFDKDISDDELETLLTSVRNRVYQEYENSFVGEVFSKNPTLLKLNYKDSETNKNSFFQLVKQIQDDGADEKKIAEDITKYIKISVDEFKTDPEKMKADVKTKVPLVLSGGSEIFGANTYFEIKKFGPNVDSHLSEFFAIFKQTYLSSQKPEYIDTYNNLIKTLYNEVKKDEYSKFLDNIKSKIGGIILDNYIIIKIEDVDLYWSFLGQRKNENRLSIRYQLKSGNITGYECNPSNNILKEVPITPEITGKIGILE
jgi:hypothetical protein